MIQMTTLLINDFIDKYLAIYDGTQLAIYKCEKSSSTINIVHNCDLKGINTTLSKIFVTRMQLPEDRSTSLLVGVSETSKLVVTWEIVYADDDAGTIQDVVFCGEESMQWDTTPSNIASIPSSSCNTTSTLLDRLESSEEDNVAMTVAIGSDVLCYQPFRTVDQKVQWKLLYQLQTDSKRVDIVRRVANMIGLGNCVDYSNVQVENVTLVFA